MPALRLAALAAAAALLAAGPVRAQVSYADVTVSAGVSNPVDVQGVAWGDANGDGHLDVYLPLVIPANPIISSQNQLYINDGTGFFTDEATARGVADDESGFGAGFGDIDQDGDVDLVLANGALGLFDSPLRLYVNDGAGNFTDDATARGLDGPDSGRSVTWADFDNDGDLDLLLVTPAFERQYMFRNDGGSFTDVTAATGLDEERVGNGAAWADYDEDGDQDLYVVNLGFQPFIAEPNRLYRNELVETGTASFTDVAGALGVDDEGGGYGAAWGDYDNDGDLDLDLANGLDPASLFGAPAENLLFRNELVETGAPGFTDVTASAFPGGIPAQVSFSAAWGDLDNDGWLDLYVTNSVLSASDPANAVYRNLGDGTFEDVSAGSGADDPGSGQGTALADYDGDGDLDIFVANLFTATDETAHLYQNVSPARHWLVVDTVGVDSNRDGVGALLRVVTGGGTFTRHVYSGSGYISQDSLDVEFGLGAIGVIERLEIHWPSGCVQVVESPPVDTRLVVVEDCLPGFEWAQADDDPCDAGITLTWDPALFASGVGHYEVRRGTDCADAAAQPELLPRPATETFFDATTAPGTLHGYLVTAIYDVNGTEKTQCVEPVEDVNGSGFVPLALADPNPACVDQTVMLVGEGPPGADLSWDWDGDGLEDANGAVVMNSWSSAGTRTVRLTVTSVEGCTEESTVDVDVLTDTAPVVDPLSLRVAQVGADVELSWAVASGTGGFRVHRSLDVDDYAPPLPPLAPIIASPATTTLLDTDVALSPGEVAFYRVYGRSCNE